MQLRTIDKNREISALRLQIDNLKVNLAVDFILAVGFIPAVDFTAALDLTCESAFHPAVDLTFAVSVGWSGDAAADDAKEQGDPLWTLNFWNLWLSIRSLTTKPVLETRRNDEKE